jgi:hypothetical protein
MEGMRTIFSMVTAAVAFLVVFYSITIILSLLYALDSALLGF